MRRRASAARSPQRVRAAIRRRGCCPPGPHGARRGACPCWGAWAGQLAVPAPAVPHGFIVRLRGTLERGLSAAARPASGSVDVAAAAASEPAVTTLVARHGVRGAAPLYAARTRVKAQRALSDAQLAGATRQRFAARAARAPPAPPRPISGPARPRPGQQAARCDRPGDRVAGRRSRRRLRRGGQARRVDSSPMTRAIRSCTASPTWARRRRGTACAETGSWSP